MNCPNKRCNHPVPDHSRNCIVCGEDAGFPNVRAAQAPNEVQALRKRVADRQKAAEAIPTKAQQLRQFMVAATSSVAVLAINSSTALRIVKDENQLYNTFYKQTRAKQRLPESNEADLLRTATDSRMFPHYHEEIAFAALSLDGLGAEEYGEWSFQLSNVSIQSRATVFERNSLHFLRDNPKILAGAPIPAGLRARWRNRGSLAVAKFAGDLKPSTKRADFPEIFRKRQANDTDFIEVHIYGQIHRIAIEQATLRIPTNKTDKAIGKSVTEELRNHLGITVTEV